MPGWGRGGEGGGGEGGEDEGDGDKSRAHVAPQASDRDARQSPSWQRPLGLTGADETEASRTPYPGPSCGSDEAQPRLLCTHAQLPHWVEGVMPAPAVMHACSPPLGCGDTCISLDLASRDECLLPKFGSKPRRGSVGDTFTLVATIRHHSQQLDRVAQDASQRGAQVVSRLPPTDSRYKRAKK